MAAGSPVDFGIHAAPRIVDWDGDGDPDILAGGGNGYIWLIRNDGSASSPSYLAPEVLRDGSADLRAGTGYTGVCFADITGDGKKDLVVAHSDREIRIYENRGDGAEPRFDGYVVPVGPTGGPFQLEQGTGGRIDIADWDGDGLLDLIAGGFEGHLHLHRNVGTTGAAVFAEAEPFTFAGVKIKWPYNIHPRAFDINGDGHLDILYGLNWGDIGYLLSDSTPGRTNFTARSLARIRGVDNFAPYLRDAISDDAIPDVADFDADGTLDLLTGGKNGKLLVLPGVPLADVFDRINGILTLHLSSFQESMQRDGALRKDLFGLQYGLREFIRDFRPSGNQRDRITEWYAQLFVTNGEFFRYRLFDIEKDPLLLMFAAQAWINFLEVDPENIAHREKVADFVGLPDRLRAILVDHGTLLVDNARSSDAQRRVVYDVLSSVSGGLRDVEVITINEFYPRNLPPDVRLEKRSGVNIFGIDVGLARGPGFPSDAQQADVDVFTIALVHEVNHTVDARSSQNIDWLIRKARLIEAAAPPDVVFLHREQVTGWWDTGVDWTGTKEQFRQRGYWDGVEANWARDWNAYWQRSEIRAFNEKWLRNNLQLMIETPQEAFATLSNQYFADSAIMFDLALRRWARGIHTCINQVLFFADTYSEGGDFSFHYRLDLSGRVVRYETPIERDERGRVAGIWVADKKYRFQLDEEGMVVGISEEPIQGSANWRP
jgi:hypothetical protein